MMLSSSARTARRWWCSCISHRTPSIWKKGCAHFFVKDLLQPRGTIIPAAAKAATSFSSFPNTHSQLTDAHSATELALDSVVKIFTVCSSPNYFLPWQNKPQRENMGSGFALPGKKILTNAHVVADHTFVLVRKHGSPTKYRAEIQAIGHECDLAILVVESEEFWHGMNFLEFGDIPCLQEAVAVVGYPQELNPLNMYNVQHS